MEIADDFQAQTGIAVSVETGPSSSLARQIELGQNADLFLSADEEWADYLEKKGLVAERRDLLGNRLVVIVPDGSTLKISRLEDLTSTAVRRLALAGPAVPAGRYAREALSKAGIWKQVSDRVLQGGDVRATLAYVVRGEADAGIVYGTDAMAVKDVRVALEIEPALHRPIRYPLVLVKREPIAPAARQFYEAISSPSAAERFRRRGFQVLP